MDTAKAIDEPSPVPPVEAARDQTVKAVPPEYDLLDRQRIRMDGWFTGPTW
jgi:hypothetical protein